MLRHDARSASSPAPLDGTSGSSVNPAGDKSIGWSVHYVVVKEGRVFDALTGPGGLSLSEYKALWQYADMINFGF